MTAVKPVMLVIDESSYSWYLKLHQNDIPSLRWHVLLDSPSPDFTNKWNGRNIAGYLYSSVTIIDETLFFGIE